MITYSYMEEYKCIQKFIDEVQVMAIPENESNSDYQQYLAWKAEQEEVTN